MLVPAIRILLGLTLCLIVSFCMGCPSDSCVKHQDIAGVRVSNIDSVAVIVNNSIAGCKTWWSFMTVVGSKTHNIRFPINMRVQLFSEEDLWKELSFEMSKNTLLTVHRGLECLQDPFLNHVESVKKNNRFINSFQTDDFCWLIEKMDESYDDEDRCMEYAVQGEVGLCRGL